MKKLSTLFIIAFALILGLTQCRKNAGTIVTPDNPAGDPVFITLNVGDGDKHIVYPSTGAVVYTDGTSNAVSVAGMKTTATIDFASPGITLNPVSNNAKWAILLPQDAITGAAVTVGDDYFTYNVDVPAVAVNDYVPNGVNLVDYVFTVNGSGKKVHFSPGNLQYKYAYHHQWRFAEHQYDVIGEWNPDYNWVDLFGWGKWGYDQGPIASIQDNSYYQWTTDFYETVGGHSDWFTLSKDEWLYLVGSVPDGITGHSTNRRSNVNGVNGQVIRPDGNTTAVASSYTAEEWAAEQAAGSVFLPAAGFRSGTSISSAGQYGDYWSSTSSGDDLAWSVLFFWEPSFIEKPRYLGYSVRLVRQFLHPNEALTYRKNS